LANNVTSRYEGQAYALFRIVAGFLFLWHGAQKLFGWPPGMPPGVPAFITYVAGPIELVGGVLIMIGLFTRPVAFLASGLMAAAYWMGHGTKAMLPLVNQGELAALYCFAFLFIAARGGGMWSVDAARAGGAAGAPALRSQEGEARSTSR
jgi:putative oxidoreductase